MCFIFVSLIRMILNIYYICISFNVIIYISNIYVYDTHFALIYHFYLEKSKNKKIEYVDRQGENVSVKTPQSQPLLILQE